MPEFLQSFFKQFGALSPARQAILAWSQPGEIIGLALRPHPDVASIADAHVTLSTGVIAHTIHFQEQFDPTEWLLVRQCATAAGRGRVVESGLTESGEPRLVLDHGYGFRTVYSGFARPMVSVGQIVERHRTTLLRPRWRRLGT